MTAPRWLQVVLVLLGFALATGAAAYLAGFFFLAASGMNPLQADLGTYYPDFANWTSILPDFGRLTAVTACFAEGG